MIIQAVLDLMLFKLAFHTYEALTNKEKMRKIRRRGADIDDKTTDIDLISNMSGESTITMGGPAGPQKEKKLEAYDESLDVKLNKYLMKWIVIVIFYQIQWIFGVLGVILPGMPLVKICLSFWITLPQFRGEFFIYEALAEYILRVEGVLLAHRSKVCSHVIRFFANISAGSLKSMIAFASEEAILKTQEQCKEVLEVIHCEILCRCDNSGKPLPKGMQREFQATDQRLDIDDFTINLDESKGQGPRERERDTYIREQQSNQRLKLNQTIDFSNMDSIDFGSTIMTPQHSEQKLRGYNNYESHIRAVPPTNATRYMERGDMFNDDMPMGRGGLNQTQHMGSIGQLDVNRQMTSQEQDRLLMQEQQMRLRQQQRFQQQQAMNQSMYLQMPQERLDTDFATARERDLMDMYARQNMRDDVSMRLAPNTDNFEMVDKDNISQRVKPSTGKVSNPLTERRKMQSGVSSSAAKPTTSTGVKKTTNAKGSTSKR